jgi:predicted 2-oxoglutarate/Fe(II)-dependent dioxygenase YbiX
VIPYVTISGAVGEAFADRLLAFADAHQSAAVQARLKERDVPDGRLEASVRSALVIGPLGEVVAPLDAAVEACLPDVRTRLGVGPFVQRRKEFSMVAYGDGAFYTKHIDTSLQPLPGRASRQVTFVYYFHREPKAFTGGALRLYDFFQRESVDLSPERDMLVAFPSWMTHEVLPVSCPGRPFADGRFAVNVWVLGTPDSSRGEPGSGS